MDTQYYDSKGKKSGDLWMGFLGTLGFAVLLGVIASASRGFIQPVWVTGGFIWIIGLLMFFGSGRRFVAIGMLCTLLIPLLAIGACFAIFANSRF